MKAITLIPGTGILAAETRRGYEPFDCPEGPMLPATVELGYAMHRRWTAAGYAITFYEDRNKYSGPPIVVIDGRRTRTYTCWATFARVEAAIMREFGWRFRKADAQANHRRYGPLLDRCDEGKACPCGTPEFYLWKAMPYLQANLAAHGHVHTNYDAAAACDCSKSAEVAA